MLHQLKRLPRRLRKSPLTRKRLRNQNSWKKRARLVTKMPIKRRRSEGNQRSLTQELLPLEMLPMSDVR